MAKTDGAVRSLRSIDVRDAALTLFAERGYHATSMKDIAAALQLQAPSLYNHVSAKQEILRDMILDTMVDILKVARSTIASSGDTITQLRRATEAHVRFHARNLREVRVGNHELAALEEPHRSRVTEVRRQYSDLFVGLIEKGVAEGVFETRSPMLAAYAILQMGIGVSMWYQAGGALTEDDIVYQYGDIALAVVRARVPSSLPAGGAVLVKQRAPKSSRTPKAVRGVTPSSGAAKKKPRAVRKRASSR